MEHAENVAGRDLLLLDLTRPGRRGHPDFGPDRATSWGAPAGPEIRPRGSARPRAAWCGQNVHWGADDLRLRGGEPEGRGDGEQPQSHSQAARGGCEGRRRARTYDLICLGKVTENEAAQGRIQFTTSNSELLNAIGTSCQVAAGTSWLWARPDAVRALDILFVDEAAQVCLANLLAVSQAAPRIVLLGDPQQLDQPMQGSHPDGTAVSAMDYLLDDQQTVPEGRGLFLEETWRLHSQIAAFTSELFYEGRLLLAPRIGAAGAYFNERVDGSLD